MITATIGNLFESKAATLVNTVNCVGVMGKGVALEFKKRFPGLYKDYVERCRYKRVKLGEPYVYQELYGPKIINFPTKDHWRSPSKLSDIGAGLDYLATHAEEWGLTTIAMPPLGCGNGGLDWVDVGPLIYGKLERLGLEVEVFAPYGTPATQLTQEFLAGGTSTNPRLTGRTQRPLADGLIVLLETLRLISLQPHAQPIGRTKFQKVAYALTYAGVPTGFNFTRGSYGPFSPEARDSVSQLANANLLEETPKGQMIMMRPTSRFNAARLRYADVLGRFDEPIAKTTDLFSRVHTTEQAELTATVLYAYEILAKSTGQQVPSEAVLTYVTNWKKHWANDPVKAHQLEHTTVGLALLGWAPNLKLREGFDLFDDLPEPAVLA